MRKKIWITAVLTAAVLLAAACTKKESPADTTAPVQTEQTEESGKETEGQESEDSLKESEESKGETQDETREEANYYMLQGTVTETAKDGSSFTLQADDGKDYEIDMADIRDVEADIKEDIQIAIGCIGAPSEGLEKAVMVVALPEQEEWSIVTVKGRTTSNAMSSFAVKTEDGQELSFLKDNCPIEEGALGADSGDLVEVTYITSQDYNYPLEIKGA